MLKNIVAILILDPFVEVYLGDGFVREGDLLVWIETTVTKQWRFLTVLELKTQGTDTPVSLIHFDGWDHQALFVFESVFDELLSDHVIVIPLFEVPDIYVINREF